MVFSTMLGPQLNIAIEVSVLQNCFLYVSISRLFPAQIVFLVLQFNDHWNCVSLNAKDASNLFYRLSFNILSLETSIEKM